jgi:uncharacterized protein YwqG
LNGQSFDNYVAKHRRDAVLLHRPYPPHSGPKTNSKFGGLPRLPDHYEWPRDGHGNALHFLAQIDCADIPFGTPLPERGVLFFFAREDEEQIWNDPDWLADAVRVIYALDAFALTPPRAHPDDLGTPGGNHYPLPAWRGLVLEGEDAPKLHVEWPIQLLRIETWPDELFEEVTEVRINWVQRLKEKLFSAPPVQDWQAQNDRHTAYSEVLQAKRFEAFERSTGKCLELERPINGDRLQAQALFEYAETGGTAFPFFWINIRHAASLLLWTFESGGYRNNLREDQLPLAREWLTRSKAQADDAVPNDADRAAFREWLMQWHKERPDIAPDPLRYDKAVNFAVQTNIRSWSGDPEWAAKIPAWIYEAMRQSFDEWNYGDLAYSQMLGHAPSAQEPLHPDDPTLCLINLCTDDALGTMYGDVGNAAFFISPADLAKRDFRNVEGEVMGH